MTRDSEAIFKAKQELNLFLKEHPEYQDRQKSIDLALKKAGNQHNRLAVIQSLMMQSLFHLNDALQEIKNGVAQVQDITRK